MASLSLQTTSTDTKGDTKGDSKSIDCCVSDYESAVFNRLTEKFRDEEFWGIRVHDKDNGCGIRVHSRDGRVIGTLPVAERDVPSPMCWGVRVQNLNKRWEHSVRVYSADGWMEGYVRLPDKPPVGGSRSGADTKHNAGADTKHGATDCESMYIIVTNRSGKHVCDMDGNLVCSPTYDSSVIHGNTIKFFDAEGKMLSASLIRRSDGAGAGAGGH